MNQQNKSFESKFTQASYPYKTVLEAAKLAYAEKTKESTTSKNLALRTLGKFLIPSQHLPVQAKLTIKTLEQGVKYIQS